MNLLRSVIITVLFSAVLSAQGSLENSKKLLDLEKYKEAQNNLKQLVASSPSTEAYFYLGKSLLADSLLQEAQDNFLKAKNADEENPLGFVAFGIASLIKNDSAAAVSNFEEAIDQSDSKDLNIYLEIADAYILTSQKKFMYPISKLNEAKEKNWKKSSEIYTKLGDIYYILNDGSNAINNYQTAIAYDKENIHPYLRISDLYVRVKNYTDAEQFLKDAKSIDSLYAPTYRYIGEFYNSVKQYELSEQMYKKYLELTEITTAKKERYAVILYLAKKYEQTVAALLELELIKPLTPQLQHILAFSFYSLDNFNNGIAAFEKYFSQVNKSDITTTDYEYFAKLLGMSGKDSLAVVNYRNSLELNPENCALHGEIAASYFKMKKWSQAADEYKTKQNCSGKFLLREYFDYGRSLMMVKRYQDADSVFLKITELKPEFPLGYLMRARTNSSIDTTSELGLSKPHYEKFIELAAASADAPKYKNDLVEAYSYLGYYFYLKKDDIEFKTTWEENFKINWQKVLDLDPKNTQAAEALKITR